MIDVLSWICLMLGSLFSVVGAIGLLRLPDFYTRMHGGALTDTLGAWLILLGLMLQAPEYLVASKLVMIGLLLALTSPVSTHALARSALHHGQEPLQFEEGEDPISKP